MFGIGWDEIRWGEVLILLTATSAMFGASFTYIVRKQRALRLHTLQTRRMHEEKIAELRQELHEFKRLTKQENLNIYERLCEMEEAFEALYGHSGLAMLRRRRSRCEHNLSRRLRTPAVAKFPLERFITGASSGERAGPDD